MKFQSPSLPELHAFLAVCQLGSFRRAADVLCVTQAAVSKNVQRLEQRLGCSLFDRAHANGASGAKGVVPTARGQEFQSLVEEHVAALEASLMRFGCTAPAPKLRLSVVPTLGTRWLMPRLANFQAAHPAIELELRQFHHDEDFARDDVDIWIDVKRPSRGWPRDIRARYLLGRDITPACTPALAARLKQPSDLLRVPLLHHTNFPGNWALWLRGVGVGAKQAASAAGGVSLGAGFDLGNNLIVAACANMGAIVIQPCLIEAELASGQLVLPFKQSVSTGRGYYVCHRASATQTPAVMAFTSWLERQASGTQ